MTESAWKRLVIEIAESNQWQWMHVRPARTNRPNVWKTPIDGPLGTGWPDLTLVRGGRWIVAELKADDGRLTDEQNRVLLALWGAGAEMFVWRPRDVEHVREVLA